MAARNVGLADRAWFALGTVLGRALRASRYATVRYDPADPGYIRKKRSRHAPLLVWLGEPLVRILGTGVVVLRRHAWHEHERALHHSLRGASVHVEDDGTLVLPMLPGETLADLLEHEALSARERDTAIALAARALEALHRSGFTHGDAMAENVMVDLEGGAAHWFDFETVHEADRELDWRRADDVRALLATTLLRTAPSRFESTLSLLLDACDGDDVLPHVTSCFSPAVRASLIYHLGQAPLTLAQYQAIHQLLQQRTAAMLSSSPSSTQSSR